MVAGTFLESVLSGFIFKASAVTGRDTAVLAILLRCFGYPAGALQLLRDGCLKVHLSRTCLVRRCSSSTLPQCKDTKNKLVVLVLVLSVGLWLILLLILTMCVHGLKVETVPAPFFWSWI